MNVNRSGYKPSIECSTKRRDGVSVSPSSAILTQALWRGIRLTVIGIVLGILGALATTRMLENFPYEIELTDPMTVLRKD